MYANFGIMMGSWHTPELDVEATINALGVLRIAQTRDLPSTLVMTGLFDAYVEQFRSALETCDRSRFKPLRQDYQPDKYLYISHIELYSFDPTSAPELVELHTRFWLDALYSYNPVQHLRFTSTTGYTTEELRLGSAKV